MKWYEPLYIGDNIAKYADRIRKRLESGQTELDHYIVTFAASPADYLDVMNMRYLTQDTLRKYIPPIVGIAKDKSEAMGLVVRITEECVRETGGADLRGYLMEKGRIIS